MVINSAEYLANIIKKNFNEIILKEYNITLNGKNILGLKLDAIDAFDFVVFTGAMYLPHRFGLIIQKEIRFYKGISEYDIDPGYFRDSHGSLILNSSSAMNNFYKIKEDLLKPKIILFYEYKGLSNFETKVFQELKEIKKNPIDFILFKIDKKKVRDLEGFFEYITNLYFNKIGYFTLNSVPWGYHGTPDFMAVDYEIFQVLFDYELIDSPCSLYDLVLLSSINKKISRPFKCRKPAGNYELYIGEVKTDPKYNTNKQIKKYLNNPKVYIHDILEINPLKSQNLKYGLLNVNKNLDLVFNKRFHGKIYENREELINLNKIWFEYYIKALLLHNIPWLEIEKGLKEFENYNDYIKSYSINQLCENILHYRNKKSI